MDSKIFLDGKEEKREGRVRSVEGK